MPTATQNPRLRFGLWVDFRNPPQSHLGLDASSGPAVLVGTPNEQLIARNLDYRIGTLPDQINAAPIAAPQKFMDQFVGRIEKLFTPGYANIWARATALPDDLKANYDTLWTPERMDRVIKALKTANIAMEINDRLHTPSAAFIQRAKAYAQLMYEKKQIRELPNLDKSITTKFM